MTKQVTHTLTIAALSALLAVPAMAQDYRAQESEIIVQPRAAAFAETVGEELNDALYDVPYPGNFSGVVRIAFTASADGSAQHARVVESSGSSWVDRSAMRAINRLDDLGPSPRDDHAGQPVLATIVYATSRGDMRRMMRDLDTDTEQLFAAGAVSSDTIAITFLPGDRG